MTYNSTREPDVKLVDIIPKIHMGKIRVGWFWVGVLVLMLVLVLTPSTLMKFSHLAKGLEHNTHTQMTMTYEFKLLL